MITKRCTLPWKVTMEAFLRLLFGFYWVIIPLFFLSRKTRLTFVSGCWSDSRSLHHLFSLSPSTRMSFLSHYLARDSLLPPASSSSTSFIILPLSWLICDTFFSCPSRSSVHDAYPWLTYMYIVHILYPLYDEVNTPFHDSHYRVTNTVVETGKKKKKFRN